MRRRMLVALLMGSALGEPRALPRSRPPRSASAPRSSSFTPNKVTAKLGQPVVLVLTSEDRIHGFKMPDFGLRTDIVPGQETRVTLTPDKAGSFTFFCDVFCGDGHEDMEGTLVVEA